MSGSCSRSTPGLHRDPQSFCSRECSTSPHCCSAVSAGSFGNFSQDVIWKRDLTEPKREQQMITRRKAVASTCAALMPGLVLRFGPAHARESPVKAIATFSILADFVRNVG